VIADDVLQGLYQLLPASNLLAIEFERGSDGLKLEHVRALPGVRSAEFQGDTLRVGVNSLATDTPRLLQWLVEGGHPFRHVVTERADLETVFLTLTGRSLRDA
jgi:ABC-2 type transport system ATP-binding protein